MIIEFFGLPCSGKTHNYLKLKKILKYKTFSYIDIYYLYLKKILYLNIIQSIFFNLSYNIYLKNLKNFNYYTSGPKKKRKYIFLTLIKNLIKKIIEINNKIIKKKFLKILKVKEKRILNIFYKSIKNSPLSLNEKILLQDRVEKEFIGLILIKKFKFDKLIILNDEGFLQRLLTDYSKEKSLNENKNLVFKNFKIINNYIKINFAILTKTNISRILKRAKKRKKGFKYSNFSRKEVQNWNKLFNSISFKNRIKIFNHKNIKKIVKFIQTSNI